MKATKLLFAAALSAIAVCATSVSAEARVRSAHASVQTGRGVYTADARTERLRGSRTRDVTVTGPNGGQRVSHDARTWSRDAGTYSRDHLTTYNDGTTRTVDVDAARTGPGQYSGTRTVTGRNGVTRTQTGVIVVERTP